MQHPATACPSPGSRPGLALNYKTAASAAMVVDAILDGAAIPPQLRADRSL